MPAADEFAAFVDRYRIDHLLLAQHWQRLSLGLAATAAVVAYNLCHRHASDQLPLRGAIGESLVLAYLGACLVAMVLHGLRLRREFHRPAATLRDQVRQVVNFVSRWGNLLMFLAAAGHFILVIATMLGLDLRSHDGRVLLGTLVPMALVLWHGFSQIPNRARLLALHGSLDTSS
jgi:hypothetical protein